MRYDALESLITEVDALRVSLIDAGGPRAKRAARRLNDALGHLYSAREIVGTIAPGDVELPPPPAPEPAPKPKESKPDAPPPEPKAEPA